MQNEEAILRILCEINNRLSDIARTMQIVGCMRAKEAASPHVEWETQLREMLSEQSQKYAYLEIEKT